MPPELPRPYTSALLRTLPVQREHITGRKHLPDEAIGLAYDSHALFHARRGRLTSRTLPCTQEPAEVVASARHLCWAEDAAETWDARGG